jgi:hypothetical protein
MSDLTLTWPVLLGSTGVAFLIGFVYMILMRYCSGVMTWLSIILYFFMVVGIGYLLYNRSQQMYGNNLYFLGNKKLIQNRWTMIMTGRNSRLNIFFISQLHFGLLPLFLS